MLREFSILSIDLGLDNLGYCELNITWSPLPIADFAPDMQAMKHLSFVINKIQRIDLRQKDLLVGGKHRPYHENMCHMIDEFQKLWLVPDTTVPRYNVPDVKWVFLERQPPFNHDTLPLGYGLYGFLRGIFPKDVQILFVDAGLKRAFWLRMGICLDDRYKDKHDRNKHEAIQCGEKILTSAHYSNVAKNQQAWIDIQTQDKQDDMYDALIQALAHVNNMCQLEEAAASTAGNVPRVKRKRDGETASKGSGKKKRKKSNMIQCLDACGD